MTLRMKMVLMSVAGVVLAAGVAGAAVMTAWKWTYADSDHIRVKIPEAKGKKQTPSSLESRNRQLQDKLSSLNPKGINIVVDTAANKLYLRQNEKVLREAKVSCGSGNILPNPNGKEWVFDSPRGEYKVERKLKSPLWYKPDWAFIEEGKPIPKKGSPERYEEGVLGDYAMGIGNGFFLHGTMYTRMLGRNVTHGCVRIGDEDLKVLYSTVPLGTKVYLY